MKIFCINIYDEYRLHSQTHSSVKCVHEHVIYKCKNIALQDYRRVLVIPTTIPTFWVRLPFSTIKACFQNKVIFDHKLHVQYHMLRPNIIYTIIYTTVIQYKIQEICTKRQKPIHIITGCMSRFNHSWSTNTKASYTWFASKMLHCLSDSYDSIYVILIGTVCNQSVMYIQNKFKTVKFNKKC